MVDIDDIVLSLKTAQALGPSHQRWFAFIMREFCTVIAVC